MSQSDNLSRAENSFEKPPAVTLGLLPAVFTIAFAFAAPVGAGNTQTNTDSEVAARIAPVGKVAIGPPPAAPVGAAAPVAERIVTAPSAAPSNEVVAAVAPAVSVSVEPTVMPAADGRAAETLYQTSCMFCHSTGAANAPKITDTEEWQKRFAQGLDAMAKSAAKGKGAMPPRGGSAASDDELKAVIEYILKQAGVAG